MAHRTFVPLVADPDSLRFEQAKLYVEEGISDIDEFLDTGLTNEGFAATAATQEESAKYLEISGLAYKEAVKIEEKSPLAPSRAGLVARCQLGLLPVTTALLTGDSMPALDIVGQANRNIVGILRRESENHTRNAWVISRTKEMAENYGFDMRSIFDFYVGIELLQYQQTNVEKNEKRLFMPGFSTGLEIVTRDTERYREINASICMYEDDGTNLTCTIINRKPTIPDLQLEGEDTINYDTVIADLYGKREQRLRQRITKVMVMTGLDDHR